MSAGFLRAEVRTRRLEALLARAGESGYPALVAQESASKAKLFAVVAIPAGVAGGVLVSTSLLPLVLAPLSVLLLPEFMLRDRAAQRKEGVERELPFFSILVNVLAGAGVSLYAAMEGLAGSAIFPAIKREALRVQRDVTVFGMNPTEALEKLAAQHPSRRFETFLVGYASKERTGADLGAYLEGESGSFLRELEEAWGRYAARVGVIGSLMITVFGVVPLLLLVVGFFAPSSSIFSLTLFTFLGIPMMAVVLIFLAGRMQPVAEDPVAGRPGPALIAGVPGVALWLYTGEAWLGAAVALLCFTTVYGWSVRGRLREIRETDDALPAFTKDILEFKRQEYDLGKAVLSVSTSTRYSRGLDAILGDLAAKLRAGVPLGEAEVEVRTRLGRVVFFVLKKMAYSGGGTVDTLFQLSKYTSKVMEMKKSAQAEIRPYSLLAYTTPVLLAFGVTFVGGVLSSLAGGAHSIIQGAGSPEAYEGLQGMARLLIVLSAAALGTVGAKISDLTAKNTLSASKGLAIAAGAIALLPLLNFGGLVHGSP